ASSSIPFFLRPRVVGGLHLLDGGLMSNFPAWLFDEERDAAGWPYPTFGFKLVQPRTQIDYGSISLPRFIIRVLLTAFAGDELLETRQIEDLYIVPLNVSTRTLDFSMSRGDQDRLYDEGKKGADAFF